MISQTLIFLTTCSSLLILSLHNFFQTCDANCIPSACGLITNISSPLRLKGDPDNCGYGEFELSCENNVTFLFLNSQKYYVKAINYGNNTIRLVDASLNKDDICSFPIISAYHYNFTRDSPNPYSYRTLIYPIGDYTAQPVNLMTCSHPLKNSSLFTDITADCASSNSSHHKYAYIKVGRMTASELPHTCAVDLIVMTSWEFKDLNNVSLSEIHHSLSYGFELIFCSWCDTSQKWEKLLVNLIEINRFLLIPLAILGVSLPVTIILGLTGVVLLSLTSFEWIQNWLYNIIDQLIPRGLQDMGYSSFSSIATLVICVAIIALNPLLKITIIIGFAAVLLFSFEFIKNWYYTSIRIVGAELIYTGVMSGFVICAPRIIICPFVAWFLIYKFRKRRLSVFDAIESFLQSENKLMPIRYSYTDLKKMTKGFQDKLGQGGYGSVFKGKLRSGHLVAVKLLIKSGGNGQDFMNEIATIGRIHHVNVVKLVGYCAQGSKRALVFDFMPKSSLDKYLSNREKTSSLNWDRKFDIALGVARGIEYLHRGCDVQILHFDIKPHNILLDDNFTPKISDFGMAKFCSIDKNAVTMTTARGTIGYVAPELINRSIGTVSNKADVYSFGMLLVEMVGLKRDLVGNNGDSSKYFPCWIYDCFKQGKDIEIGDADENDSREKVIGRKMTIVALWCILMSPDDRPSMCKVLEMLEGDVECLLVPDYPSQSTHVVVDVDETGTTCSTDS